MEQIESSIRPVGIANRFRDLLQILKGQGRTIYTGDEFEVALISRPH
jgi:hypothetical protein